MTTPVAFASYRERVGAALADGSRFAGLHATSGGTLVRTLLADPDGTTRLETVAAEDGVVPSIVDLAPAAGWDEREAHDLQGIRFAGHEPLRPLVNHDPSLERWVPVRGDDVYQLAVGPIHAGIIESGHFRFHLVGDRILHLDAQLFYKHRGLERAAEGKTLDEGLAYVSRACAACNVANGVAYATACEDALGLVPTAELRRARTILLELERTWSHLNDIAAICAGVSLAAGNNRFAALTERARRLNAVLTGHRFLFNTVRVGGSELTLDAEQIASRARRACLHQRGRLARLARAPLQHLLPGSPPRHRPRHRRPRRAAGRRRPRRARRRARPRRARVEPAPLLRRLSAVVPERAVGDVQARFEQRALELWQTFAILDELLDRPLRPASAEPGGEPHPIGLGRVESPRGATSCVVERRGDRSNASASAPAPTPTGRSSPTPPPTTCSRTSR